MRKIPKEENENGSYRDILEEVFLKQIGITYAIGVNMNIISIYYPKSGFENRIIFGDIGREYEEKAGYWIQKIEKLPSVKNRDFLYWTIEDKILQPVFFGELNEKNRIIFSGFMLENGVLESGITSLDMRITIINDVDMDIIYLIYNRDFECVFGGQAAYCTYLMKEIGEMADHYGSSYYINYILDAVKYSTSCSGR